MQSVGRTRSDADDVIRNYSSAAGGGLLRVLHEAIADLGLEDPAAVSGLVSALSSAYVEGIRTGQSEVLAQAIEQGVDVTLVGTA
jgi:hypothetical protein